MRSYLSRVHTWPSYFSEGCGNFFLLPAVQLFAGKLPPPPPDLLLFQLLGCENIPLSKNELARSCKNLASLQESCMQDLHPICPFSCTILHDSCTILAQSCMILARNGARQFCKRCCKNNYLVSCTFFCKILQELVQDCARLCKNLKGTYHVQVLHARFLQDSCMILQVRFCWAVSQKKTENLMRAIGGVPHEFH